MICKVGLISSAPCTRPILSGRTYSCRPRLHTLTLTVLIGATLLVAHHPSASAVTKTVCKNGTCDYATIDGAVDSIPLGPGVTIEVKAGTYRERVQVTNRDGTASQRAVIKAIDPPGTVIVDGSDAFTWTEIYPHIWSAYIYPTPWDPPTSQVFVDSVRYTYVASNPEDLLEGECTTDTGAPDWVYINSGSINPNTHSAGITNTSSARQRGFEIENTEYLTIDGFTVRRCREEGIRIRGPAATINSVIVKNCNSVQNWKRGIHLENCQGCSIESNATSDNGGHGIYLIKSIFCQVTRNRSYRNNKPDATFAGVAGIRIGDSNTKSDTKYVTVDYNVAYENEDTGIDLKGGVSPFFGPAAMTGSPA